MLIDFFYNIIFIPLFLLFSKILRKFNIKLDEREKYLSSQNHKLVLPDDKVFTIWFHSASMGEFEQAKPIIEKLKEKYPKIFIVVTFFSPSGFNTQKNYPFADYICYLPFDTNKNATEFVNKIKPNIAIFIRYEIWRNYLKVLNLNSIPSLLIDATRPSGKFFRTFPLTKYFIKSNLNLFNEIHTVGEIHSLYFKDLKLNNVFINTLTDTRFDRISEFVQKAKSNLIFPEGYFTENEYVIVAGSTWEEDEEIIIETIKKIFLSHNIRLKTIFVPHEPTQENLLRLTTKLDSYIFLSDLITCLNNETLLNNEKKLLHDNIVVDSIGYLLRLYNYADFAYIGGAFGAGIHSVTEPAGYGLPIVTGPHLAKSMDAQNLKELGSLHTIKNANELQVWIENLMKDTDLRNKLGIISRDYIFNSTGSSIKIIESLEKYINK